MILANCVIDQPNDIYEIEDDENILILGMDSISIFKVVTELEDEYGIEFDDEDLKNDNLKSISNIVGCVEIYLKMKRFFLYFGYPLIS